MYECIQCAQLCVLREPWGQCSAPVFGTCDGIQDTLAIKYGPYMSQATILLRYQTALNTHACLIMVVIHRAEQVTAGNGLSQHAIIHTFLNAPIVGSCTCQVAGIQSREPRRDFLRLQGVHPTHSSVDLHRDSVDVPWVPSSSLEPGPMRVVLCIHSGASMPCAYTRTWWHRILL
jgi:hypothetical protein